MKNKEMLRNNMKRDLSSDIRGSGRDSNTGDNSTLNPYDKLVEMKKRLEILRSQKL